MNRTKIPVKKFRTNFRKIYIQKNDEGISLFFFNLTLVFTMNLLLLLVSMKFKFLNRSISNKRFDYSPLYYDERKQRLEQKRKYYEEQALDADQRSELFRQNIRENWSHSSYRQEQRRKINIRTFLLIALILALGYLIFSGTDQVDTVVTKLW